MKISEAETVYQALQEQSLRGELDEAEFKTEVERLRFEDAQGRQWKIGWYTGKWYRHDLGRWIQDTPPDEPTSGRTTPDNGDELLVVERRARPSVAPWLAPAIVCLVLLASATLIVGWNAGWWNSQDGSPPDAAAMVTSDTPPLPTSTHNPAASVAATPVVTLQAEDPASPAPNQTPEPTSGPSPARTPTQAASPPASAIAQAGSAPSGRIYFPVFDPDRQTFDITAVQLESGERQVIVEQASQPAISPNGERLAYRSWDRSQRSILVQELEDGHTWVWINFAEAARPSWSPDSQNIVFPSQQEPDREWRVYRSAGLEFDRVRRDGGDILGRVPVWLADGRIIYWDCPLDKCGLYTILSDGSQPVRLTEDEHDTDPAASPDGSQIAFMSNRDGNWEIYRVDADVSGNQAGQEPQRLTQNPARDGLPAWSPDGQWLAFVTDREGEWAIWAMRPDGSAQQRLFDLGGPLEGEIAFVQAGEQHGWTWETIAWGP